MLIKNADTGVRVESRLGVVIYAEVLHSREIGAKHVSYEFQMQKQLVQAGTYERHNGNVIVQCEHTCEVNPDLDENYKLRRKHE